MLLMIIQTQVGQLHFFLDPGTASGFAHHLISLAEQAQHGGIVIPRQQLPPDLEGRL